MAVNFTWTQMIDQQLIANPDLTLEGVDDTVLITNMLWAENGGDAAASALTYLVPTSSRALAYLKIFNPALNVPVFSKLQGVRFWQNVTDKMAAIAEDPTYKGFGKRAIWPQLVQLFKFYRGRTYVPTDAEFFPLLQGVLTSHLSYNRVYRMIIQGYTEPKLNNVNVWVNNVTAEMVNAPLTFPLSQIYSRVKAGIVVTKNDANYANATTLKLRLYTTGSFVNVLPPNVVSANASSMTSVQALMHAEFTKAFATSTGVIDYNNVPGNPTVTVGPGVASYVYDASYTANATVFKFKIKNLLYVAYSPAADSVDCVFSITEDARYAACNGVIFACTSSNAKTSFQFVMRDLPQYYV